MLRHAVCASGVRRDMPRYGQEPAPSDPAQLHAGRRQEMLERASVARAGLRVPDWRWIERKSISTSNSSISLNLARA